MTATRSRRLAALATAAVLVLAACGEDPSDVAAPAAGAGDGTSIPPTSSPIVAPAAPAAGADGESGERTGGDPVEGDAQGGRSEDGEETEAQGGQTEGAAGSEGGNVEQQAEGDGGTGQVRIREFQFVPQVVTVEAGTTLGWVNEDSAPHRIVAVDGTFSSEDLQQDDNFAIRAPAEGEHPYICGIHPQMTGTIVVE